MVTVEELQTKFNGLVPDGVSFTLDELAAGSKDDVENLCTEWGLTGSKIFSLKYVYDNHPTVLARPSQNGGK